MTDVVAWAESVAPPVDRPARGPDQDLAALLDLSEAIASSGDFESTLHHIAHRLAESLEADRCAVVVLDETEAIVIADSELERLEPIRLELSRYPEIREVVRRGEPVVVDDVAAAPLFDEVRACIEDQPVGSVLLFPLIVDREVQGVLHLRARARRASPLRAEELRFGRIVANTTGVAIRNARLFEQIRARNARVLSERVQAERRLRQIEKYQRFFDLAGDGLIIADGVGKILFANQAAERLLGFDAPVIQSLELRDLAADEGRDALRRLLDAVVGAEALRDFELPVLKASGDVALFSVTTAALDHLTPGGSRDLPRTPREATAILSFRDVTETRRTEDQLRRTNTFLMNILESSADAIVVADRRGAITIFNEVATQITGYTEVEAKRMSVESLYPEGGAHRIMEDLRSPHFGGPGKLEERRDVLRTKQGDEIPVNLAAAIVYDQGQEIATVGIFSDLRERLRMEDKLRRAQQAAAVVETAGAAAHELNQPLTAVMGSVDLLNRKVPSSSPARPYLDTILESSERMASIVGKLSQITQYRTKAYVGATDILDLDAAASTEEPS